jgi:drug/metabolite transporter (DMT)-like permease
MLWGGLSSVIYTLANIGLRQVADCDPFLVSCVKAMPTALISGLILLAGSAAGRWRMPPTKPLVALMAAAALAQLGGNGSFQWALGEVGLALAVPIVTGVMIVGSATLGRVWLGESVSFRTAGAILLLIIAVIILSAGAPVAQETVAPGAVSRGQYMLAVAIAISCFAGIAYATLNVVLRHLVTRVIPLPMTLFVVSGTGLVVLGIATMLRLALGSAELPTLEQFGTMLLAGSLNAAAFFAMAKALHLLSVATVNAVNASQTALGALAGVALFHEPLSTPLMIGVALTTVGLLLVDRAGAGRRTP